MFDSVLNTPLLHAAGKLLMIHDNSGTLEADLHRCSFKKVFWQYAANLQENTHAEV